MNLSFLFRRCRRSIGLWGLLLLPHIGISQAIVIDVRAIDLNGAPIAIRLESNDILAMIDQVIQRQDELEALVGLDFTADVNYLGVEQSITLDVSADAKNVTVNFPLIEEVQIFDASNASALVDQVTEYVKEEGAAVVAEFRAVINKTSPVGITDGNPNATTALTAREALFVFGLDQQPAALPSSSEKRSRHQFSFVSQVGQWEAGGLSGQRFLGRLAYGYQASSRWRVEGYLNGSYSEVEAATLFGGGGGLGVTVQLKKETDDRPWAWQATPFVQFAIRGSEELAAGGALWSAGISSQLSRRLSERHRLGWISQFSFFGGIPMEFDGYDLEDAVDQQILKNALEWTWTHSKRWSFEGWIGDARFLQDAAIQQYQFFGLRANLHLGHHWSLRALGELQQGKRYQAENVHFSLECLF